MKNNNTNMNVNYKLLFLIPLFMTMGCRNVYKSVVTNVHKEMVLARDIASGEENMFIGNPEDNKYIRAGDTIDFYIQKSIDKNGEYYKNTKIFYTRSAKSDMDALRARQERERFDAMKRNMLSQQKSK